ncbi:PREDICTED: E3 ubiquitin-protein ligase RNF4-like, partial [Lepidothrix coronata]|uniref:E3 ubiquitin-protein ligase RNF4-like n=1 Tax=Lepidothrix coronata TaxID=321398 RepID=A0A6J0HU51_9PASS
MSTRQRKRCGEPVDSRQARKRRRLVASNTGGASEAEPVDPRESAVEEVIDLTDRSSEPEVSDLTDDNSVVQWQPSQQYPRFFRAADNSAVLLMSDNEEEQGDYDE